ncbi:hypothetical protein A2968_00865 [Candidatus Gottesmanbacteria bacterium RIFCSPLOWO2_01_FULL_42_22]|uniref:Uncharacterized protein n=1 Tax=Candidatus Gottesmanbacteria bacterium RIFCSPLOWO2_01_FULL_42_22 TaxID=1798391 RepID=A0A1F6BIP8_9BACT|nr:MAG: hypothetical protein A2968_00865 [Candidatus Gottesmanbacteria bacterium RIFCSPLOWO2_01_FULL_42_22]
MQIKGFCIIGKSSAYKALPLKVKNSRIRWNKDNKLLLLVCPEVSAVDDGTGEAGGEGVIDIQVKNHTFFDLFVYSPQTVFPLHTYSNHPKLPSSCLTQRAALLLSLMHPVVFTGEHGFSVGTAGVGVEMTTQGSGFFSVIFSKCGKFTSLPSLASQHL